MQSQSESKIEYTKGKIEDIIYSTNTDITFPNFIINLENEKKSIDVYSNGYKYEKGDTVYIEKIDSPENGIYYNIGEYVRSDTTIIVFLLFIAITTSIYGWHGIKSIVSLTASLAVIYFVLLPLTLIGYNPVLIACGISIPLLFTVMFLTHGYNRITLSAMLGCFLSIAITVILSYISINTSKISGYVDDYSSYLYFQTSGQIDFTLLVIASIIIGVIGVVDDAAITQARIVAELKDLSQNLTSIEYYKRAMNVGKDHAGAMINTLILAYTSSSLPLLLLFYTSDVPREILINKEIITTEILRSLIGSMGLLLAIPLTTAIAVKLIKSSDISKDNHIHSHTHTHTHIK